MLDGVALDLVDLGRLHGDLEARATVHVRRGQQVVGLAELVLDDGIGAVPKLPRDEPHPDRLPLHRVGGASVAHALLAQHVLDLLDLVGQALGKRLLHVHLQHELRAPLEV